MNALALTLAGALLPAGGGAAQKWAVSWDGHARTMYESYRGVDFGLGPVDDDDWLHQRVQLMATADRGEAFRLAAELTWGRMWGKEAPIAPPDQDDPDLLQLHARLRLPAGEDFVEVLAGRQTLYYGSGRLLAAREGANQRLSHDALLVSWQRGSDMRVDAFIASPVAVKPGAFDNVSKPPEVLLWSVYAVMPLAPGGHSADFYYIGLRDEDSIFAPAGGTETRHTAGARFWKEDGAFTYNSELILQWGDVGGREILAGAASFGLGHSFANLPWKPEPELRADAISGGDEGGTIHTFHPLFQANNYFNEGGFLSPANLYNLNPLVSLHPADRVTLSFGVNFQWLFSTRDAIYGPPLQRLGTPVPGGDRYLGTAFNASATWELSPATTLFLGYTRHESGPALNDIGGEDVDYFQTSFRHAF